ncbi:MAG: 50S ribosomal protein L34e [Nanoarchaeota archaeon]
MPQPGKRSRTLRRVYVKTPGNRNKILYKVRKPKTGTCANCGATLHGLARGISSKIRNLSKSSKHPKRIFGGNLCHNCAKLEIIKRTRK